MWISLQERVANESGHNRYPSPAPRDLGSKSVHGRDCEDSPDIGFPNCKMQAKRGKC